LFVIEQSRVIDMYVVGRNFVAEGKRFKIVLGRRFLQFCNFVWDGPTQTVKLTIGTNASAF